MSFFAELKRRNVVRVGVAYAIATWLLLQVVDVITPILALPEWAPKLIFVFLAVGFVPALIFAWAFELTPEGLKKEADVDRSESITNKTGRKLDFTIIAILLVAIGLLVYDRFSTSPEIVETAAQTKSIAVLPFVNMSSDAEQEFFSDGITEEILNSLAAIKQLKVAGRTSSFAFKGQNDDLRRIGDALGVDHILEGSVRKSGTKIRITAQLIQVEDGFHMWSETYDRELTDIFEIQDEIAKQILTELKTQLLDDQLDAVANARTSPEVYELYLLAKQRLYTRTEKQINDAVRLLDEAIALDPEYAPALAQRGIATIFLADDSYGTIPADEALRTGRQFIERALDKDPELAEAWAGMGLYYVNTNNGEDLERAKTVLTRALDLNPNLLDASNWLSIALSGPEDAQALLELSRHITETDPLYRPGFGNAVSTLNSFGLRDEARALIDRFSAYSPGDSQLLQAESMHHFYSGESAAGLRLAEKALALAPNNGVNSFAVSIGLQQSGQLQRLAEVGFFGFAVTAHLYMGQPDQAIEKGYEQAREGILSPLFTALLSVGKSAQVIDYVEERWPDLDAFARAHPPGQDGYTEMQQLAYAYAQEGNQSAFEDALDRASQVQDVLEEQKVQNLVFSMQSSSFFATAGNTSRALDYLEMAIKQGANMPIPFVIESPEFTILLDEPRYIVAEAESLNRINGERAKLDLPPLDPYGET